MDEEFYVLNRCQRDEITPRPDGIYTRCFRSANCLRYLSLLSLPQRRNRIEIPKQQRIIQDYARRGEIS